MTKVRDLNVGFTVRGMTSAHINPPTRDGQTAVHMDRNAQSPCSNMADTLHCSWVERQVESFLSLTSFILQSLTLRRRI
jgi:hypothetical protein